MDQELFRVVEQGNLRLIAPAFEMGNDNAGWTEQNKWNRSRVETLDGKTVSQGFPKFWNLGMGPEWVKVQLEDVVAAIRDGRKVHATLKYDGSLLIRSVHDGKVMVRTRGSFSHEFHDRAVEEIELFKQKYPALFSPSIGCVGYASFLFEWLTPNAQIVIKYNEPELRLIGAVLELDTGLQLAPLSFLKETSELFGVPLVENFELNDPKQFTTMLEKLVTDDTIEGYVLRMNDEQTLVKVKSDIYIAKHALKSDMTFKNIVDLWISLGAKGSSSVIYDDIRKNFDDETAMWFVHVLSDLDEAINSWNDFLQKVTTEVDCRRDWIRKDFALKMKELCVGNKRFFSLAMILWQNHQIPDRMIRDFMYEFDKEVVREQGT